MKGHGVGIAVVPIHFLFEAIASTDGFGRFVEFAQTIAHGWRSFSRWCNDQTIPKSGSWGDDMGLLNVIAKGTMNMGVKLFNELEQKIAQTKQVK